MKLYSCDGKYNLSFFTIFYDSDQPPESVLREDTINTILHEYLHFTQDICTTYGLANMSNVFSGIAYFYNDSNKNISLPFDINTPQYIFETNQKLFFYYLGNCSYDKYVRYQSVIKVKINELTPKKEDLDTQKFNELKYHSIKLTCKKYDGSLYEKKYEFGAIALMECMSNIYEKHFGEKFSNTYYRIPYDLPEIIINKIYPELAKKDSYIYALCDAAMMFFNPGDIFIKALKKMKIEKFIPSRLEDIYIFFNRFIPYSMFELYEKTKDEALKNARNIVNAKKYRFAYRWIRNTINHFYEHRKNDIAFLARILEKDPTESKIEFLQLIKNEISPLIFNKKNKVCFLGNTPISSEKSSELFYWYNLSKINYYIFSSPTRECPYIDTCTEFINCSYAENPLIKKLNPPYCIFQQMSKCVGLIYKNVIN